jgi:hypothetical protein
MYGCCAQGESVIVEHQTLDCPTYHINQALWRRRHPGFVSSFIYGHRRVAYVAKLGGHRGRGEWRWRRWAGALD